MTCLSCCASFVPHHLLRALLLHATASARCCYWSACSCCCAYCCCSPLLLLLLPPLPCLTCCCLLLWLLLLLLCSPLGHVCTTTHASEPSPMCSATSMGPPARPCHPVRPHGHPGPRTCSVQCSVTSTRVPVRPHVVLCAGTHAFAGGRVACSAA